MSSKSNREMYHMFKNLLNQAQLNFDNINKYRKDIHKLAETGFNTHKTVSYIENVLDSLDVDYEHCGTNGIIATISGKGNTVAILRADMDALPMREESGLLFAAENGNCHACGHDMHTSMLLGAAKILKDMEKHLNGKVKLIFQPAEETLEGCKNMLENGMLNDINAGTAIMLHVLTGIELSSGTAIISSGGVSAPSADFFKIEVTGKSSHGSTPHKGTDALSTAAHILINLQHIQTHELPSNHNSVLTIGQFQSGKAANIIADRATICGTLRALDENSKAFILKRIKEISENTAKTFNTSVSFKITSSCPALLNDSKISNLIGKSLMAEYDKVIYSDELGNSIGGSEDFSYITHKLPSLMISLVAGSIKDGYKYQLHHPKVMFDESVLPIGSALYTFSALKILENSGT